MNYLLISEDGGLSKYINQIYFFLFTDLERNLYDFKSPENLPFT